MRAKTTDGHAFSAGGIMLIVIVLLVGSLLGMGYFFLRSGQLANDDQVYIQKLGDQRVLSQEIAKLASQAARGRLDAFPALQTAYNKFDEILNSRKSVFVTFSKPDGSHLSQRAYRLRQPFTDSSNPGQKSG